MSAKLYLDVPLPHVLAHRGLHTVHPENTIAAFAAALDAGATHLETDAHVSSDGVAMLVHDPVIVVEGEQIIVADLTARELASLNLGSGQGVPTLADALSAFPHARFNIDIKVTAAGPAVASAVEKAKASHRVLIASFKAARRTSTVRSLPGVATSASATVALLAVLCASVGLTPLGARFLRNIDAVQLPTRMIGLSVFTHRLIGMCHRAGVVVHAWTINEPDEMRALLALGVDGLVTDRCDLAVDVTRSL
jgi:glycerophosphoryl diester phosphodiesterase